MILNYIWILFFLVAFVAAVIKLVFLGDADIFKRLIEATFSSSKTAFEISLGLTGVMTLWLGIMKIGEKSGAIGFLSRAVSPFFSRLFPGIPKNHPASGNIIMNFSANMLGLGNAATPMGLKAMQSMQELNTNKDTASNSQIMFLVINTAGFTILPVTIIALRAQQMAASPADVFIPIILATFCSTLIGIVAVGIKQGINFFDRVLLTWIGGISGAVALILYSLSFLNREEISNISSLASSLILFSIIIAFIIAALRKKINVYESFIEGAKGGFETAVKIIPYLVGMLVAISVFRVSECLDIITNGIAWMFTNLGVDTEFVKALPVAFMKPFSGGGSQALMVDTMKTYGADSFAGRLACVFQGAADTTFYIVALYFGSVGISKTRYAIAYGLIADLAGITAAIGISYLFFH